VSTSPISTQAASSLIPSIKTISGGTLVDSLLTDYPDLTRPTGVQHKVRQNTAHHIQAIPGPPVICRPQRLTPDQLTIAKAKFDAMLQEGIARRSKSSWSSTLYIVPKKDNGWPTSPLSLAQASLLPVFITHTLLPCLPVYLF
jgi:hypothetical protein